MSKLDDLMQKLGDICHEQYTGCNKARNTGNSQTDFDYCYTDEVVNMLARPEAKASVKALMLELIGEDYVTTSFGASRELMHVANGEKAKFRKKVEEL